MTIVYSVLRTLFLNYYRQNEQLLRAKLSMLSPSYGKYTSVLVILQIIGYTMAVLLAIISLLIVDLTKIFYFSYIGEHIFFIIAFLHTSSLLGKIGKHKDNKFAMYNRFLFLIDIVYKYYKLLFIILYIDFFWLKVSANFIIVISIILLKWVLVYYGLIFRQLNFNSSFFKNFPLVGNLLVFFYAVYYIFIKLELEFLEKISRNYLYMILFCLVISSFFHILTRQYRNHFFISDKCFINSFRNNRYHLIPFLSIIFLGFWNEAKWLTVDIQFSLLILAFYIYLVLLKQHYFHILSFEGYKTFIFYMRQIDYPLKKYIINRLWLYLYLVRLSLLMYIFYISWQFGFKYGMFFLALFIFEALSGTLITLIFPANLFTKDNQSLSQESRYLLPTVFIPTVAVMYTVQKRYLFLAMENVEKITIIFNVLFFLVIFLIFLTGYLFTIWLGMFLEKIYKDKF